MSPTPRLSLELTNEGRFIELPGTGRLVIGCDPSKVDLVLEGQGVAEVHCTIGKIKGGGWALKDLGSEYGSLVNGKRAGAARLVHGDLIVLGSKRIKVVDLSLPQEPEPAAEDPVQEPPAPVPNASTQFPGYQLSTLLGRGGMGEVWLAKQVSLDRQVALKVLSAKLEADTEFVERFQAEARAAAALNHPNLVTVHDVGCVRVVYGFGLAAYWVAFAVYGDDWDHCGARRFGWLGTSG